MKALDHARVRTELRPAGLGHVGLAVEDIERAKDFYTRVIGLHVSDESPDGKMVFLSSQPETEHHELLISAGRTAPRGVRLVGQISFHVDSLETLQAYVARLKAEQVNIRQIVTHGNAIGCYFNDPEDNMVELYWQTGKDWHQPYSKPINVEQPIDDVLSEAERLLDDGRPGWQPRP